MGDLEEGTSLRPFFAALERGFNESAGGYRFCAGIGERKLMLCFPSREQAGIVEQCLLRWRIPEPPAPDARFCLWRDDCFRYIGPEAPPGRWRYREKGGWLISSPGRRFIGADVSGNTFYYCLHDPEKRAPIPYWVVSVLVSQWAGTAGLLPVHGGAVGAGGRGVLLIAQGGGGKSTLAASCLLSGMDYVADDYVLVSAEGPVRAMPVFSTLKMNLDMKGELGLTLPVIWVEAARNGKQLLDASSFPICRDMDVRAVVFLSRRDQGQAKISPASGPLAVRLAQAALRTEGAYDPLVAKAVVRRLSGLPAYEMRLGGNLRQNADTLRAWIERME